MKQLFFVATMLLATAFAQAQTDSTTKTNKVDTIKVGNFVIIKKNKNGTTTTEAEVKKNGNKNFTININTNNTSVKKKKNISTNWWILDLGFANYRDQTNYTAAQNMGYLRQFRPQDGKVNATSTSLNTGKSSNVNIWFFMQKLNISKNVLNLKYGLGLEMYNFRYDRSLSFRQNPQPMAYNDSIGFSKNKLFAKYITVPFMLNFNANPDKRKSFSLSAGVSAGYLIGSRNKQISNERGKEKFNGDLALNPWRFAAITELGIGPVRLFGSYSFNALHKSSTGLEQYPYSVGIRFSNW